MLISHLIIRGSRQPRRRRRHRRRTGDDAATRLGCCAPGTKAGITQRLRRSHTNAAGNTEKYAATRRPANSLIAALGPEVIQNWLRQMPMTTLRAMAAQPPASRDVRAH